MERTSPPVLYLAFANSSRKKKGSKELKALQQELTSLLDSLTQDGKHLLIDREGIEGSPYGYHLLTETIEREAIEILYIASEPTDLDHLYFNATGGSRKTIDWDQMSLEQLPNLKLVIVDGGGSLELVERFLFAGAPMVVASQYEGSSPDQAQASDFHKQVLLRLGSGRNLQESIEAVGKLVSKDIQPTLIPSDPYEYWDFKEAYEEKGEFVWGSYVHSGNAELLNQPIFLPTPEAVPPAEAKEEVPPVEESVPVVEAVPPSPKEEVMLEVANTPEPKPEAPEQESIRILSQSFGNEPSTRYLQDIREYESEGILRKVAYWSQALSTNSFPPPKQRPSSILSPPIPRKEPEIPGGRVLPLTQPILEEEFVGSSSNSILHPPAHPPLRNSDKKTGSFHKLLAMVGMGALLLIVGSGLLYNYFQPNNALSVQGLNSAFLNTETYNVLLLPFLPGPDCSPTDALNEMAVRDHLSSLPESAELGIKIATSEGFAISCPASSEEAKRIGEVNNAHLVIWGSPTNSSGNEELVKIQYVALNQHKDPLTKSTKQIGYQAFEDVYDLQEGFFAGRSQDLVYWILAVAHLKSEGYPAAISYIEQITVQERPEFSVLMQMLAKCYLGMERFEDALKAYDEAIYLNPHNPNVYHHRGRLHQQLNHKDLALSDYTEAIRLNPKHLKAQYQRRLLLEGKKDSGRGNGSPVRVSSR